MPKLIVSGTGAPVESLTGHEAKDADAAEIACGDARSAERDTAERGDMLFIAGQGRGSVIHDSSIGQYDFTFKAGGKSISGILVARRESIDGQNDGKAGGIRVLGTTYFGMRLFDISVGPDSYRMNSCADFLDRKQAAAFLASRLRKKFL